MTNKMKTYGVYELSGQPSYMYNIFYFRPDEEKEKIGPAIPKNAPPPPPPKSNPPPLPMSKPAPVPSQPRPPPPPPQSQPTPMAAIPQPVQQRPAMMVLPPRPPMSLVRKYTTFHK